MDTEDGWVGLSEVVDQLQSAKESACRCVKMKSVSAHRTEKLLHFRLYQADNWVKTGGDPAGPTRHQGENIRNRLAKTWEVSVDR